MLSRNVSAAKEEDGFTTVVSLKDVHLCVDIRKEKKKQQVLLADIKEVLLHETST